MLLSVALNAHGSLNMNYERKALQTNSFNALKKKCFFPSVSHAYFCNELQNVAEELKPQGLYQGNQLHNFIVLFNVGMRSARHKQEGERTVYNKPNTNRLVF